MTDIDELFHASAVRGRDDDPDTVDLRDDLTGEVDAVEDIGALVEAWNADHTEPIHGAAGDNAGPDHPDDDPSHRRRGLAGARQVLSRHIGGHPEEHADEPTTADGQEGPDLPVWQDGHIARADEHDLVQEQSGEADVGLVPELTRRERRRSRREIDRLRRDSAPSGRAGEPDDDGSDVTIIGPESGVPLMAPRFDPALNLDDPVAEPATRSERRRAWKRSEKKARTDARKSVRFPILTRSILLWLFIFMVVGVAFGASGAFWWSQFNSEVAELRDETQTFTDQVENASGAIETQRSDALVEIDQALAGFEDVAAAQLAVGQAGELYSEKVWFVETLDDNGAASVGSAFPVAGDDERTLLVTSLATVASSTISPAPTITLRSGERELAAELWSWDEKLDIALLSVADPELERIEWVSDAEAGNALGAGVFVLGGLGGGGAAAVPGVVVDQSAAGLQHTATVGSAYQGGPILSDGKVVAIASLAYQPLGFDPGDVRFAVPVGSLCESLLVCGPGGPTAGADGGPELEGSGDPAIDAETPTAPAAPVPSGE